MEQTAPENADEQGEDAAGRGGGEGARYAGEVLPEPGGEVYMQAKSRAMARYADFLKSAGKAMVGDSKGALAELVNHGQDSAA